MDDASGMEVPTTTDVEVKPMSRRIVLSPKSVIVMELIAKGHSYDQILRTQPDLTYRDIFESAQEIVTRVIKGKSKLDEIRERYPRAYIKWTSEEDGKLESLLRSGVVVTHIAQELERGRSGVFARVAKLGLSGLLAPADRTEFEQDQDRRASRDQAKDEPPSDVASGATTGPVKPTESSSPAPRATAAQRMGHPLARPTPPPAHDIK